MELVPVRWTGLSNLVSLFGLGLLVWGVSTEVVHLHTGAGRWAAWLLLAAASISWIVALVLHRDDSRTSGGAIGVLAVTGGALVAFAPTAMVFPAVAVLSAAVRWRIQVGAVVVAAGWVAVAVAELAVGPSPGVIVGSLAAMLGGALIGLARRQGVERTEQLAQTEVERLRAEVERERAELLTERNHLAREIHDVLAHTLAALSLQLEAFGTVVESEPGTSPAVRAQVERTRRLVHEGLEEARGAVRVLRDDAPPLEEQLRRLCTHQHAVFTLSGQARALPPEVAVGLYRATQEALTNVMKHATGAPTTVGLTVVDDHASVVIENEGGTGSPALQDSGGGYGLQGISERLALLGGRIEAGPTPDGWRVTATAPLTAPVPPRQPEDVR
jgi:signal transduction histidine kinase